MAKLLKIVRDVKFIQYVVSRKGLQAEENAEITCKEAPLASFDKALQDLGPTACRVLGLPKDYADGMVIRSLSFSYTKKGTASAVISFDKSLSSPETVHRMATPMFRFEKAADGEEGRMECTPGDADKMFRAMKEAESYIAGKRQQMLLPLEDPNKPAEPAEGAELPGMGAKK